MATMLVPGEIRGSDVMVALAALGLGEVPAADHFRTVVTTQEVVVSTYERDGMGRMMVRDGDMVTRDTHIPIRWGL